MNPKRIVIVGGGAAGFFAAIAAAERGASVTILEKTARVLDKVRISGGGRCNVTHACFELRDFATRYPRGGRALLGPFQKFSARDTVAWFEARGVKLKTENDGRMFPITDSSQTIVDCLLAAAQKAGVNIRLNCEVAGIVRNAEGEFQLTLRPNKLFATGCSSRPAVVARPPEAIWRLRSGTPSNRRCRHSSRFKSIRRGSADSPAFPPWRKFPFPKPSCVSAGRCSSPTGA